MEVATRRGLGYGRAFGRQDWPRVLGQEDRRITRHLVRVHQRLSKVSNGLPDHLVARRQVHLDRLMEYIERGRFPRNLHRPYRTPVFLDDFGTHCAVGYLLHRDGRDDIVEAVRTADNHVRVMDIQDGPVLEWLAENGLTQEEAAEIQPTYPHEGRDILFGILVSLLAGLFILFTLVSFVWALVETGFSLAHSPRRAPSRFRESWTLFLVLVAIHSMVWFHG